VTAALRLCGRAIRAGVVDFYNSANLTFAASIAYYALVSSFPFLLLVLSAGSKLAVREDDTLVNFLARLLPRNFDFFVVQIHELARAPLQLSVLGVIATFWASMGLFGAVTTAVNYAWGVDRNYGFFKHKLVAFLMLLTAGLVMVIALTLISAAQVLETQGFADALARHPQVQAVFGSLARNAPTPLFIVVVALIYYFVPNTKVRIGDVWLGAVLAGLLWRLTFAGFAWWVRDMSRFNVHGSISAVVVFLVWIYLSAVILLYGVEVSAAFARERAAEAAKAMAAPTPAPTPTPAP
jgi:membrane protein